MVSRLTCRGPHDHVYTGLMEQNSDSHVWRNAGAILISILACAQLAGVVFGSDAFMRIGKALGFAPYPQPFVTVNGFEAYSATRTYVFTFLDGTSREVPIDDTRTAHLAGPHRRKVAFMAPLLWAPVMSPVVSRQLFHYMFCNGPLLRDRGIAYDQVKAVTIDYHERTEQTSSLPTHFVIVCH